MGAILIKDRFRPPQAYEGEEIGRSTSRRQGSLSWVDMFAYRLEDSQAGYLLWRIGMSTIYHTAGTECTTFSGRQRGDSATIDDLPDDAQPCPKCRPPHPLDLGDDEPIRFEFPRNTVDLCPEPRSMVTTLTTMHTRGTQVRTVAVSEPVKDLLAMCVRNDPAFADAVRAMEEEAEAEARSRAEADAVIRRVG